MAATAITLQALTDRNSFAAAALKTALTAAVDATNGALITWNARDDKILVLVENVHASASKSVTIKGGDGIQGGPDLTLAIAAASYTFVSLDSGRFKNVTGTNKGKVVITGTSADIQVAAFKLP